MDVLDHFDTIKVCNGYRFNDKILTFFPADQNCFEQVEPVYEEIPGWKSTTSEIREYDDLPENARKYIEYIEQICATPVKYVSVGYRRDQVIMR
jgi:adenylosuccinate synthase